MSYAGELADGILERFGGEGGSAFSFTAKSVKEPMVRQVEWYDNATPAGNSTLVHLFAGLAALTGKSVWRDALQGLKSVYGPLIEAAPNGVAYALAGWTHEFSGLAVLKAASVEALKVVSKELEQRVLRPVWLVLDADVPEGRWRACIGPTCLPDFASANAAAEAVAAEPVRT